MCKMNTSILGRLLMSANPPVGTDGKLWVMPALLEAFGLAADFKCLDAFYDHKPWGVCIEFGAFGVTLTIGGIVWGVFRKRIAELWPWNQLRAMKAELTRLQAENAELKKQIANLKSSRLTVSFADYRAVNGEGDVYDVTKCLQDMVRGDGLVLQIENHNFWSGDVNYVPTDPKKDFPKRLLVTYSYAGRESTIERPEHVLMVIPEDDFLRKQIDVIPFSPLQIYAFQLARDIRQFLASFEPCLPATDDPERIAQRIRWQRKLTANYELHFAQKAGNLLTEFAAAGHPIDLSLYRQGVHSAPDDIAWEADVLTVMALRISGSENVTLKV
jgi:cell division protein FtsB